MFALTKELEQSRETWHASGKNLGKNLVSRIYAN